MSAWMNGPGKRPDLCASRILTLPTVSATASGTVRLSMSEPGRVAMLGQGERRMWLTFDLSTAKSIHAAMGRVIALLERPKGERLISHGEEYPHQGGCLECRAAKVCNVCGEAWRRWTPGQSVPGGSVYRIGSCTNGRCLDCHGIVCTPGLGPSREAGIRHGLGGAAAALARVAHLNAERDRKSRDANTYADRGAGE